MRHQPPTEKTNQGSQHPSRLHPLSGQIFVVIIIFVVVVVVITVAITSSIIFVVALRCIVQRLLQLACILCSKFWTERSFRFVSRDWANSYTSELSLQKKKTTWKHEPRVRTSVILFQSCYQYSFLSPRLEAPLLARILQQSNGQLGAGGYGVR